MTHLLAQQLVYGRVEPAYSRTGRGGLQTLWRSRGLHPGVAQEIESIVRCFDATQEQRLQFVRLSDGRFLISQTHPSGGKVVDRSGRDTFICRALVVDTGVFGRFDQHPLRFATANPFTNDVEELLEIHGSPPAEIEPLALNCASAAEASFPPLSAAVAAVLVRGAFAARHLRSDRRVIFLRDSSRVAEKTLAWLFDQTPIRLRQWCSFTTQTDRCTPASGLFWLAAGSSKPAGQHSCLEVRLDATSAADHYFQLDEAKEMLINLLAGHNFRLRRAELLFADAVCLLLTGTRVARLPKIDPEILAELLEQHPEKVMSKIEGAATPSLGHQASALARWLMAKPHPVPPSATLGLLHNADRIAEKPDLLLDLMEPWMAVERPRFSWWYRRKLTRLATRRKRRVLAHWLGQGSMSRWRTMNLEAMNDREFGHCCLMLGVMPPAEFVCQRHLTKLLQDQRAVEADDQLLLVLLARAASIGAHFDPSLLKDRLARLRPDSMRRLIRLTEKRSGLKRLLPIDSKH